METSLAPARGSRRSSVVGAHFGAAYRNTSIGGREKKKQYHAFLIEKTADNWQRYQIAKKEAKKAVASEEAAHYADLTKKLDFRNGERYVYQLTKTRNR
nr:unnamed protein product [Haemonchus contortus]